MHLSICDYVIEIVHNSIEAGAKIVNLKIDIDRGLRVFVEVSDDGKGMSQGKVSSILDPFYTDGEKHLSRDVGLGLSFLKQAVDCCGGQLSVESELGKGTSVSFDFDLTNIDTPPVGDIASSLACLMSFGESNIVIRRVESGQDYVVCKDELVEALGEIESVGSKKLLIEFFQSQEKFIKNGG